MKAINQQAKKVMDMLTEGMDNAINDHKIIDNAKGTFMAVHVELIGTSKYGPTYSIAHYYIQNGDSMRDPDIEIIKSGVEYYPVLFWQDAPFVRDEPVTWKWGEIVTFDEERQAALVTFVNIWMANIKEQQGLVI